MILISIIIPTKNRPKYLENTLRLFERFNKKIEVIVIDDASSSNNAKLNRENCELINNCQYKYLRYAKGASKARNYGISISHSDYIWFLDDDDIPSIETIYDLYKLNYKLLNNNIILLPSITVYKNRGISKQFPSEKDCTFEYFRDKGQAVNTSCAIFPREKLLEVNGWDESLVAGQDTDLFLRISQIAKFKCLITKPVIINVGHSNRISRKFFRQQYGKIQFLKKHWNKLTTKRKIYYIVTFLLCTPLFHGIKLRIKLFMVEQKKFFLTYKVICL